MIRPTEFGRQNDPGTLVARNRSIRHKRGRIPKRAFSPPRSQDTSANSWYSAIDGSNHL